VVWKLSVVPEPDQPVAFIYIMFLQNKPSFLRAADQGYVCVNNSNRGLGKE